MNERGHLNGGHNRSVCAGTVSSICSRQTCNKRPNMLAWRAVGDWNSINEAIVQSVGSGGLCVMPKCLRSSVLVSYNPTTNTAIADSPPTIWACPLGQTCSGNRSTFTCNHCRGSNGCRSRCSKCVLAHRWHHLASSHLTGSLGGYLRKKRLEYSCRCLSDTTLVPHFLSEYLEVGSWLGNELHCAGSQRHTIRNQDFLRLLWRILLELAVWQQAKSSITT